MISPAMKSGTKRLSDIAKFIARPSGIVKTGWGDVEATCRERLGIVFDEWQCGAGKLILSKTSDGKLAAMIGGAGMSLPRQVGKTYLLAGLIFGLCVNEPGMLVIWSAQHAKTHAETFLAMQAFAQRSKIAPYIAQVYTGSGDEEIRFANGSRILFGARERGFGRGIPGVDILVMDEAQILSDKAIENMLATLNTSSFGLALYIGTPPKPEDMSAFFTRMREEALSAIESNGGLTEGLVWVECGADDNAKTDDQVQWARANPSFPHRTPIESIMRLRKNLTADGFRREALGIWDPAALAVFDINAWNRLGKPDAEQPNRVALVLSVSQDRRWACIGVAGAVDEKTLVMCHSIPGLGGVPAKVVELQEAWMVDSVSIAGAQAKALEPELVKAGIEFEWLPTVKMGAACTSFQEAVKARAVVHLDQGELNTAVANAQTRMSGESEVWDRRDPKVDDSPLVACSAAFYQWSLSEAPMPAIF